MNENSQPNKSSVCKIFVGGLSWETNAEKLSLYFENFGEVVDVVVMTNLETGRSRGFGFVEFKDPASVRNVLSKSPHQLDGRNIDPKECNLKNGVRLKRDSNQSKVFVGGLPHDIKEDVLKDFFSNYGNVTEVVIMYDQEKKKTRGFGFVSFESEETVNKLVEERFLSINGKKIEIKRAEPQRPMLKSNSSSMTNISMQSSHNNGNNGYLSALSSYVPLSSPHHQLHAAAHHHHSIMPPPAQNAIDTSSSAAAFQFAAAYHHPNSYSTAIPIHPHPHSAHHGRAESLASTTPLIAGYAPTPLSSQPPSHHQLLSHQPWPLPSYSLSHLHSMQPAAPQHHHHQQQQQPPPPHHPMQSSPTAPNIAAHQLQQAMPIISNNGAGSLALQPNANLSRPDSPSSLSTSNNASTASNNPAAGTPNNQSTNSASLAQLNSSGQIHTPQSVTPTAMHQNWYPNTHYSSGTPTPVPHPSLAAQPTGLIANPPGALHGQANPAFSQAITFGYPPAGYLPAGLMSATHWQQPNPYIYGAYPLSYQPAGAMTTTSSPPAIAPSQPITPQQEAKRIKLS